MNQNTETCRLGGQLRQGQLQPYNDTSLQLKMIHGHIRQSAPGSRKTLLLILRRRPKAAVTTGDWAGALAHSSAPARKPCRRAPATTFGFRTSFRFAECEWKEKTLTKRSAGRHTVSVHACLGVIYSTYSSNIKIEPFHDIYLVCYDINQAPAQTMCNAQTIINAHAQHTFTYHALVQT